MNLLMTITGALCLLLQLPLAAQSPEASSPILFIYDASGSMWGQLEGRTKKEIASEVLVSTIGDLSDTQRVGLMAYGHRKKEDCDDVEFLVDMDNVSKEAVKDAVKGITPLGRTPLARSATLALNTLRDTQAEATIILVTDGIESCDGNICEVIATGKLDGIDFKLHIVGFGLKEGETEQLKCAAEAGGGQYYDASNAGGLVSALTEATRTTIDNPKENLSLYATKNDKPVDAWIKAYKAGTREDLAGARTYRDSAFIFLPPGNYDIEVQPLENTNITGTTIQVAMKAGSSAHRTVRFDGATMEAYGSNNNEGWDTLVKLYLEGSTRAVASTRTYGRKKKMEVDPGIYDITFDAMKINGPERVFEIKHVEFKAGEIKSVVHDFKSGTALVGVQTSGGDLIDATVQISELSSGKSVAGGRTYTSDTSNPKKFVLSPGTYAVKITTLGQHKGDSDTFNITVNPGQTTEKTITF